MNRGVCIITPFAEPGRQPNVKFSDLNPNLIWGNFLSGGSHQYLSYECPNLTINGISCVFQHSAAEPDVLQLTLVFTHSNEDERRRNRKTDFLHEIQKRHEDMTLLRADIAAMVARLTDSTNDAERLVLLADLDRLSRSAATHKEHMDAMRSDDHLPYQYEQSVRRRTLTLLRNQLYTVEEFERYRQVAWYASEFEGALKPPQVEVEESTTLDGVVCIDANDYASLEKRKTTRASALEWGWR